MLQGLHWYFTTYSLEYWTHESNVFWGYSFEELFSYWNTYCKISRIQGVSNTHCVKRVLIRNYSVPYFPAFGLNTERYWSVVSRILNFVSLRMLEYTDQSNYEYEHCPRNDSQFHVAFCQKLLDIILFKLTKKQFVFRFLGFVYRCIQDSVKLLMFMVINFFLKTFYCRCLTWYFWNIVYIWWNFVRYFQKNVLTKNVLRIFWFIYDGYLMELSGENT